MSYMQTHQENPDWLKCPTCGFCRKEKTAPEREKVNERRTARQDRKQD